MTNQEFNKNRNQSLADFGIVLAILIGLVYPLTNSIFSAISGGRIRSASLYLISTILVLFVTIPNCRSIKVGKAWLSGFLLSFIFIFDMMIRGGETQTIFLQYAMMIIYIIFLSQNSRWISFTLKFLFFVTFIYSITVWLEVIFPDSFTQFATPLFLTDFQNKYLNLHSWGYNCGLTSQVAIVCCYIVMSVSIIIPYIISKKQNGKKISVIEYAIALISLGSLLLTGKRATLIFMLFSLILLHYYKTKTVGKRFKYIIIIGALLSLFYTIGIPIIEKSGSPFLSTLNRLIVWMRSDDVTNGRIHYIEIGLDIIKQHPVIGVGWGNFATVAGTAFNAHNIYIQLLAELGIFLGIICIALMIIIWNEARKLFVSVSRIEEKSPNLFIAAGFCFLTQTYFLIYGFAGNPLYDVEYIAMYILSTTMTISMIHYNGSLGNKNNAQAKME